MAKSILIVDDHPVVLFGLRFLFAERRDLEICGEACDAATAKLKTALLKPDYVILDLVLGGRDGLELLKEITTLSPKSRVVIYSSQSEHLMGRKCQALGAWGYVSKAEGLPIVARAIDSVRKGVFFFKEQSISGEFVPSMSLKLLIEQLSSREAQVLRMLGNRLSTHQISLELGLSVSTIGTYRERIKNKLALSSVRELEDTAYDYVAGRLSS